MGGKCKHYRLYGLKSMPVKVVVGRQAGREFTCSFVAIVSGKGCVFSVPSWLLLGYRIILVYMYIHMYNLFCDMGNPLVLLVFCLRTCTCIHCIMYMVYM